MQKARETHVYILDELEAGNFAVRQRYESHFLTPERQRECIADYDRWLAAFRVLEEALKWLQEYGAKMSDQHPGFAYVECRSRLGLRFDPALAAVPVPVETPDRRHNPWDWRCSRSLAGEPSRADARCPICRPVETEQP